MIYFIESIEMGAIKIGYTDAVSARGRLRSLQVATACRLKLMGSIEGNRNVEQELHQKFAHLKIRGEWFRSTQELLQFIAEATNNRPLLQKAMSRLLKPTEVAERLGITPAMVRSWISYGHIKAVRLGERGNYRIPIDAIDFAVVAKAMKHKRRNTQNGISD